MAENRHVSPSVYSDNAMGKCTFSMPSALVWLALALLGMLAAACGNETTATPASTPLHTPTPGGGSLPRATATATPNDGAVPMGWTADLPTGGQQGQLARSTPVTLADGSTATLAEVADGKPLLLYFFATW